MKLLIAAAALALAALPATVHAQAAPADGDLALLQKMRGKLVGKWLNIRGELIEFTENSGVRITSPSMQADPKMPKELKGTFVLTANMQLQVTVTNGKPMTSEFSVDSGLLRIKSKSGGFSEYQRYDTKNLADLTLRELEMLDAAMDQWAIENNKPEGAKPTGAEIQKYVNKTTHLYYALNDPAGPKDFLGNSYGVPEVGKRYPKVHPATLQVVADAVPKSYWKRFIE